MDWTVVFSAGGFSLALIIAISTFVYFIMRLITNPIKEDLDEMKKDVKKISDNMMSETAIKTLIQLEIANHVQNCPNRTVQPPTG